MAARALISVFIKDGILELARFLSKQNWEIISTGGTSAYLKENGISVTEISSLTGFPECLDGRVKTLHPAVHAGLLARRDDESHMNTLKDLGLGTIDLVCVNLYPFFDKVKEGLQFENTIEFIDIGGPSMIRSAAKNCKDVLVLTDPADYGEVMEGLSSGNLSFEFRRRLAGKAFNLTGAYDAAVARFMLEAEGSESFPPYAAIPARLSQSLRYGENAHQQAALYLAADHPGALASMDQLHGKELSYNNIRDMDIAWKAVSAFNRFVKEAASIEGVNFSGAAGKTFAVALKHNSPCGAAMGNTVREACERTLACDPVSVFGGIIGCSSVIDEEAARAMADTFLEVIVAPGFTEGALGVLKAKKNIRLIRADKDATDSLEYLSVDGGLLVQTRDSTLFEKWEVVTKARPSQTDIDEMAFGMTVALFAKSNAIVVVKDGMAIGIGAGQTNRIWAAEQALERAHAFTGSRSEENARVLVSDAFFPFADCVEKASEYGIKAIIQPGGSVRDKESIEACDRLGIAMVFSGTRHFKH